MADEEFREITSGDHLCGNSICSRLDHPQVVYLLVVVFISGTCGCNSFLIAEWCSWGRGSVAGFVAGALFVLVDAAVYYGIAVFILKRIRSRKKLKWLVS